MPDAVVIGAGPNGLVAGNVLVDEGWDVTILEEQAEPGGAVRSAEITRPGFVNDLFSAFYPLAAGSPILDELKLEAYGLRWRHAPTVLAHPFPDGSCAVLARDLETTAVSVDSFHPGDGAAWQEMFSLWQRVGSHLLEVIYSPFPPVRAPLRIASELGGRDLMRFLRMAMLPVRRFAEERFGGRGAAALVAGNAMHTDLTPETSAGAIYGWLLSCLGQEVGFPVPEGGAGSLSASLARRFTDHGGKLRCGVRVAKVIVRSGRAVAVRTASGDEIPATRAVLADVGAPALLTDLVGPEHVPGRVLDDLRNFQYDNSTIKVDWALDAPIPWKAEPVRAAGTVHVAEDIDYLSDFGLQLGKRLLPARPFLVLGQMTTSDATRSPAGTESAWAYTHVPQQAVGDAKGELSGSWDERETEIFVARMEDEIEALAPGFKDLIAARHVFTPTDMEVMDANLVGGALNGGTAQIHQQLFFRPYVGFGRPETPIRNLYLASASAHPGGGVHGAPGANAARAALIPGRVRRSLAVAGGATAAAAATGIALRRRS